MKVIGITGGIGSGKTTVTSYVESLGYSVIDADAIAHDVARQPEVLDEIAAEFGDGVILEDGQLDRKAMAEIVFRNANKKQHLESIITKRVIERVKDFLKLYRDGTLYAKDDAVFLDAPTLFETGSESLTDEVWIVTCDLRKRLERASTRDGSEADEIMARISAQMPEEEMKDRADQIISNNGSLDDLKADVDKLLKSLD